MDFKRLTSVCIIVCACLRVESTNADSSLPANMLFGQDLNEAFKTKNWQKQPYLFEYGISEDRLDDILPENWVEELGMDKGSEVTVGSAVAKESEQRIIPGAERYFPEIAKERCDIQAATGFPAIGAALHFYPSVRKSSEAVANCHLRDQFVIALDDTLLVQVFESSLCKTLPVFYGGGEDGGSDIHFYGAPTEYSKADFAKPVAEFQLRAGDVLFIPQHTRFSVVPLLTTRPTGTAASSNLQPTGLYYAIYMDIGLGSTWEGVFRNSLLALHFYCEDHEETGWCDRYYLHEDAYPGLHIALREASQLEGLEELSRTVTFGPTYDQKLVSKTQVVERCLAGSRANSQSAFTGTLLNTQHPDVLAATELCLDLAVQTAVKVGRDLGRAVAARANSIIVENLDYRARRAAGSTQVPMSKDLLTTIQVELSPIQLDDLSNLKSYPMVEERVEEIVHHFFNTEMSKEKCARSIEVGASNDMKNIGFTAVNERPPPPTPAELKGIPQDRSV